MAYRKGKYGPIEQIRDDLAFGRIEDVASMLENNTLYCLAFEQLEPGDLVSALPLVGHKTVGELVARVIAQKCPVLWTSIVDAALRSGNTEVAQKIIDEFLATDSYSYRLPHAAWWYVEYGVGEEFLRKQAAHFYWCVKRVVESFSPDEQEKLWRAIKVIVVE